MSKRENGATKTYREHLNMGGGLSIKNPAADSLALQQQIIFDALSNLTMSRFKWSIDADSVDTGFMEKTLFLTGLCVFYYEEKYDKFLALPASIGELDYMDNPISFTVRGNRFINRTLTAQECVPIWNNYTRTGDVNIVTSYAERLASLDRTVDVNTRGARQPKLLVAPKDLDLSVENFNRQIEEGNYVVRIRPELLDTVQVHDVTVDALLFEKISIARTRIWNECMGLLGIKHANQDKKERLVSDEVAANDEQISYMKSTHLEPRRIAADQIKRKFDVDVSVDFDDALTNNVLETVGFSDE